MIEFDEDVKPITTAQLNRNLEEASKLPQGSREHLEAMVRCHSELAEHWDNKVGTTNDDNKCTRMWNKHGRLLDMYHNLLRDLDKQEQESPVQMKSNEEIFIGLAIDSLTDAVSRLDCITNSPVCEQVRDSVDVMIAKLTSDLLRIEMDALHNRILEEIDG